MHRGVHNLSAQATAAFEAARSKVARFVNAGSAKEIVFTKNASEALNLVAQSWGLSNLGPGDEVCFPSRAARGSTVQWQSVLTCFLSLSDRLKQLNGS